MWDGMLFAFGLVGGLVLLVFCWQLLMGFLEYACGPHQKRD